ncbi:MAG TPA: MBL fold metallo-hydrolase [Vicinamibacterales bacterium]
MRRLLLTAALALAICVSSRAAERGLDIEWIDVEGGAATLIVTPAGEAILVDAGWPGAGGRDAQRIKAALERHGLKAIDHLITTHYHVDHYGGVPQLAEVVPVRRFYDHGEMSELAEDRGFAERYAAYRAAAKGQTTTLKPGDTVRLKQAGEKLTLTVLAARGAVVGGGPQKQNPACAEATIKPEDPSDNARSIAFVLKYGTFEFFDAGDLTWNVEAQLVCPADRVGRVDLYQVTHHGLDISNNPVLLRTLQPTVAVMNNGAKKGGAAEVFRNLKALSSLQALYALHRNVAKSPEDNADPALTANLEAEPDEAQTIRASVDRRARTFTVTNGRTGETRTFKVR